MSATTQDHTEQFAREIYNVATPVIQIYGLGGSKWIRNVSMTDHRYGPWLQAQYRVLNRTLWNDRNPCLYLVASGRDKQLKYVGISRNKMSDRWRESPALDYASGRQVKHQLFHNQCWKHIEDEVQKNGLCDYEISCLPGKQLWAVTSRRGSPLSEITASAAGPEVIITQVERWICKHKSDQFVPWNIAMTGSKR